MATVAERPQQPIRSTIPARLDRLSARGKPSLLCTEVEVEECFFVLQGHLDVFVEDESGKRLTTRLGPWECIACPAGVIHGYQNDSLEPVYFQVMIGRAKPETMGYADDELYKRRDAHLKAV